ncbi:NADH dehydrogenase [ubiquinone] 1 alpha subcomplex subunit 11 [Hyalella azteca]|uniref:NADH dehydrogenase [ubiquinone] 1 alpha subcomplex subunit 11 n=1 Tax=Hyalella azteca TaxID=294128 RepID=A0A8B7NMY2_HYAAZ|nr:NADH dehydrogenase [ubiquinone] 1 alpha subcomplex subunit 11 [Hyalella azteca]
MGALWKYSYDDYPDGTHCLYKTACVTKQTSLLALAMGTFDVINISKPSNIGGALIRYPRYMVPGFFSGLVFGLTTCTLTQMRQKDDHFNYIVGAGSAGIVIGACRRSLAVGIPLMLLFGLGGAIYKEVRVRGTEFFPHLKHEYGTFDTYKRDYTLTAERPKYTGME